MGYHSDAETGRIGRLGSSMRGLPTYHVHRRRRAISTATTLVRPSDRHHRDAAGTTAPQP
jgi:hypothetical protein